MPTVEVEAGDLLDGKMDIMAVLVKASLCDSRSDARRAVQQGGVSVDGEKVTDITTSYTLEDFAGEGKVVKRGKKKFAKVVSKEA
jgi:tyrosyl-tRNA synthetase